MKILKFTQLDKGMLRGFFDLYVDEQGYDLFGCSLFVKNDGSKWINVPSKEYNNDDGEKKYSLTWRMHEEDRHKKFKKVALDTVLAYCEENCINVT